MGVTAVGTEHGEARLAAEETRLARAAAAGDGSAFATLYERYERRAYNLAVRVTGSEDDAADAVQDAFVSVMRRLPKLQDRELAFGSYLFTATRNASYDLMQKRKRAEPSDSISEAAVPIGAAAGGGFGLDPGDPDEDPDRKLLLESQQEEIRAANDRLPERQREVLALRELEELSYDEIAEIMEMNRNSVAQLISRARIRLRDELRGTALASIASSSPDCERALPLIAMDEDGQLRDSGEDGDWLAAHIATCDTCKLGREAMQEAGTSYRAWTPIVAAPWLLKETMSKAAELTGSDWTEAIAEQQAARAKGTQSQQGLPSAYVSAAASSKAKSRHLRRRMLIGAGLTVALLIGAFEVATDDSGSPTPLEPASEQVDPPAEASSKQEPKRKGKDKSKDDGEAVATEKVETGGPSEGTSTSAGAAPQTRAGNDGVKRTRTRVRRSQGQRISSPKTVTPPVATIPDEPAPEPVQEPTPPTPPPTVEEPPVVEPPTTTPTPTTPTRPTKPPRTPPPIG